VWNDKKMKKERQKPLSKKVFPKTV
jgi:hypothetical protein